VQQDRADRAIAGCPIGTSAPRPGKARWTNDSYVERISSRRTTAKPATAAARRACR